jgi:single-strand DNA-binding protein
MSELKLPHINQVSVSGRLTQDPDFKTMENGVARLSTRMAVNRPYRDRNNNWQEETSFKNLILWHKTAEYHAPQLHKGTPVLATGRLHSYAWKDEEDQSHSKVEIQVRNLQVLEKRPAKQPSDLEGLEGLEDQEELIWEAA